MENNEKPVSPNFIPKDFDGKPRFYRAADGNFVVTRHSDVFVAKSLSTGEEREVNSLTLETFEELRISDLTKEEIKILGIDI